MIDKTDSRLWLPSKAMLGHGRGIKGAAAAGQIGIGCVALAILVEIGLRLQVNLTTISFVDLIVVFCMAYFCGFWQASAISVFAVATLDYFFTQPHFHFTIANPQDWVALSAFQTSAVVIGRLSAREVRSRREALRYRRSVERLHELSRSTLLLDLHDRPGAQLITLIQRIFALEGIAMFNSTLGSVDAVGDTDGELAQCARQAFLDGRGGEDLGARIDSKTIEISANPVGGLAIRGKVEPLVMDALVSLAAITMERHESVKSEERAENIRKSEELRATVLDALAHQVKTPLACVITAVNGLLELDGLSQSQAELVSIIDQEASRMNDLCSQLLVTAKLASTDTSVAAADVEVPAFLSEVVDRAHGLASGNPIQISTDTLDMVIRADPALLGMVLTQYIENANKYSTPGTPIQIAARRSGDEAVFSVHNYGPAIPVEDRERIFDRFYRSPEHSHIAGTGIGLSVARKAATAQRGHVWVISDRLEGTTFFLSIPILRGRT